MAANTVRTTCSGCFLDVRVDVDALSVAVKVPSNGRRGAAYVAAHTETVEATTDGDLVLWDCPACEYPDSVYADPATRRDLA